VGGIKRQNTYLGLANAQLLLNTQAAGWWRGGEFHLNFANTHGGTPSDDFIGDFQGVSNIQAGNRTFFQELWYRQSIGKLSASVGIQDMNAEFSVNEFGCTFINSSFALHSTFTDNISVSVFPITGLGGVMAYHFDSTHTVRLGVFDGNPGFMTIHPANFTSPFEGNDGLMTIGEYTYCKGVALSEIGSYKFGAYYHSHNTSMAVENNRESGINYGFYFIGNQRLVSALVGRRILDGFLQLSYSPVKSNTNQLYTGAGVILRGLATKDCSDELGLAAGYAHFHNKLYRNETVVELSYKYSFLGYLYLQPDIQYIIHPSRFDAATPNALVGILRVGLEI
jgi:porin